MAIIHTFETAKERIEQRRDKDQFVRLWSQYKPFNVGVWDAYNTNLVYKIISHPQFTGRLIPNSSDIQDEFIKAGNRIWDEMKDLKVRQQHRGYFRVLWGELKPDR